MPVHVALLSAEMFKKPLWQTVLTQIRLLIGAVCAGSTLFASILNSLVMLGNYSSSSLMLVYTLDVFIFRANRSPGPYHGDK